MKHVLLVEDHLDHAWLISSVLTKLGFLTSTSIDPIYVVNQVIKGRVQVLVVDLGLPFISGDELITRVRAIGSKIPIIVISAYRASEAKSRCLAAGADYYLEKPISHSDLKEVFLKYI
jgi:CheY-like chemotaxis protein